MKQPLMSNYLFASDNTAGIHPNILAAIQQANTDTVLGYGDDPYTAQAQELFKQHFGRDSETFFVCNGTAANVLSLQTILRPHQAVLCTDICHMHVHECGALENHTGSTLLLTSHRSGKIDWDQINNLLSQHRDEHEVQPKVISITQCTEAGTVYTAQEIQAITELAHQHQLYVHMDGARIANAVATLGCSLKTITTDLGVDVVSFGGTKNGLMLGEAIVFCNPALAESCKYVRKQGMQLLSKMRFISAQFIALFTDQLFLKNAQHANHMAQLLAEKISPIPQLNLTCPVETNMLFLTLPKEIIPELQQHYFFYPIDEANGLVRWVTSFATTEDDVTYLVECIQQCLERN